jgi:two-component system LytT family response regulator
VEKLKAIIVDDEYHGRENLKELLRQYCPEIEVLDSASSVAEAKKAIYRYSPEVVFLDVNMPVLDGFDLLDSVDSSKFMVVFVTAHEEYAIRAIKVRAIDFLLKPINIKELQQAVKRLLECRNDNGSAEKSYEKIVLPISNGFQVIEADKIIRMEAEDCYTQVITSGNKKLTISRTLADFERKLPGEKFFRIHKSHLVNLGHIRDFTKLDGGFITMSDGAKLPVARRKAGEFLEKFRNVNTSL